jgi:hypothetical protein
MRSPAGSQDFQRGPQAFVAQDVVAFAPVPVTLPLRVADFEQRRSRLSLSSMPWLHHTAPGRSPFECIALRICEYQLVIIWRAWRALPQRISGGALFHLWRMSCKYSAEAAHENAQRHHNFLCHGR